MCVINIKIKNKKIRNNIDFNQCQIYVCGYKIKKKLDILTLMLHMCVHVCVITLNDKNQK